MITPLPLAKIECLGIGTPWKLISNHEQLESSTTELQSSYLSCFDDATKQRKGIRCLILGARSIGIDLEVRLTILPFASEQYISTSVLDLRDSMYIRSSLPIQ